MGAHVDVDDFEIEVTSLWRGREGDVEAWREVPSPPDGALACSPLAPRLTGRGRMLRAGGACAAVALALLLLLSGDPRVARTLAGILPALPHATPPPLAAFAANVILYEHAAPWGTLRIDHHPGPELPIPPFAGSAPHYLSFTLLPGRHTVEYDAENFPRLTCTISVPAAKSDTCPLARPIAGSVPPNSAARLLDLGATLPHLIHAAQLSLTVTVRDALAVRQEAVTLPAGGRYLRADGTPASAGQALRAVPVYSLNDDASVGLAGFSGLCVRLCDADPRVDETTVAEGGWQIQAHVVVGWRYLDAGGRLVFDAAPAATPLADEHLILTLGVRWDDGWQIEIPSLDPGGTSLICIVAGNMAARLANERPDGGNPNGGMSLVASTGSLMLLPFYGTKMLAPSVVARPLEGEPPTVDLVMGYNKSNTSALLKRFLARIDDLIAGVQKQMRT